MLYIDLLKQNPQLDDGQREFCLNRYNAIKEILCGEHHSVPRMMIAGGTYRRALESSFEEISKSDIDIFIVDTNPDANIATHVLNIFAQRTGSIRTLPHAYEAPFNTPYGKIPVQVITKMYSSRTAVLQGFDFTCCQIGTFGLVSKADDDILAYNDKVFMDIRNKVLRLNPKRNKHEYVPMRRIEKFVKEGYKSVSPDQFYGMKGRLLCNAFLQEVEKTDPDALREFTGPKILRDAVGLYNGI